ncbi:MAG: hypothetical protein AB8H80_02330 [Planctomycetota bacterium]
MRGEFGHACHPAVEVYDVLYRDAGVGLRQDSRANVRRKRPFAVQPIRLDQDP